MNDEIPFRHSRIVFGRELTSLVDRSLFVAEEVFVGSLWRNGCANVLRPIDRNSTMFSRRFRSTFLRLEGSAKLASSRRTISNVSIDPNATTAECAPTTKHFVWCSDERDHSDEEIDSKRTGRRSPTRSRDRRKSPANI